MKFLLRLLLLLVVAVIGLAGYVALNIFDDAPTLSGSFTMEASDLAQAKAFFRRANPKNLPPGELTKLTLSQDDIEKALNYGLEHYKGGRAVVAIVDGIAKVQLSMKLPDNPLGDYLNAELAFTQWSDQLQVQNLRMGGVYIPGFIADRLIATAHQQLQVQVPEYQAAIAAINGFSIGAGQINVVYQWQPELMTQLTARGRDLLISPENQQRLLAHARQLAVITNDPAIPRTASLTKLIAPMFQFAQQRGGSAVEENRAALMAMAMYIMGVNVGKVIGQDGQALPRNGRHKFELSKRYDFAQHFLVSAGLASSAGTEFSDTVGLLKELDDSRSGGSGFSFTDLGADRTGVRLAELAVSNETNAKAVQGLLAGEVDEAVFMAEFRDLPEFMPAAEFKQRFTDVGSTAYQQVANDIEQRISQMPLFAQLATP